MKILFIHNTLAEYRISFFHELSCLVDLDILITEEKLASSIYNFTPLEEIFNTLNIIKLSKVKNIESIIENGTYDIVVLPPIDNFYQIRCAHCALLACRTKGIKTVFWTEKWEALKELQPLTKRIKNYIQAQFISFFANKCDLCIVSGTKSKNYLRSKGIVESKINVAIDSSTSVPYKGKIDIREKYNIPKDGKIILYLGRLVKRKGCEILIDAFGKLSNDNLLYLVICGEGNEEITLRNYIKKYKINNVIFTGKVDPKIRSAYFKQSNLFVLPSYTYKGVIEAWGLTVNESLEQGTPVVVTTAVGAGYDLSDNKCCIMVNENDRNALMEGIKKIMSNGDMTAKCRKRYSLFNVEGMAKSFYNVFKKLNTKRE